MSPLALALKLMADYLLFSRTRPIKRVVLAFHLTFNYHFHIYLMNLARGKGEEQENVDERLKRCAKNLYDHQNNMRRKVLNHVNKTRANPTPYAPRPPDYNTTIQLYANLRECIHELYGSGDLNDDAMTPRKELQPQLGQKRRITPVPPSVPDGYQKVPKLSQAGYHIEQVIRPLQDALKVYRSITAEEIPFGRPVVLPNQFELHSEVVVAKAILQHKRDHPEAYPTVESLPYISSTKLSCAYCHKFLTKYGFPHCGTHGLAYTYTHTSETPEEFSGYTEEFTLFEEYDARRHFYSHVHPRPLSLALDDTISVEIEDNSLRNLKIEFSKDYERVYYNLVLEWLTSDDFFDEAPLL